MTFIDYITVMYKVRNVFLAINKTKERKKLNKTLTKTKKNYKKAKSCKQQGN